MVYLNGGHIQKLLVVLILMVSLYATVFPLNNTSANGYSQTNAPTTNSTYGIINWHNPSNAYSDDQLFAMGLKNDLHHYNDYNFSIPDEAIINGIEVRLDAWYYSMGWAPDATGNFRVRLSWNNGSNTTNYLDSNNVTATEQTFYLGGTTNTWGRTWIPSDFTNKNFELQLYPNTSASMLTYPNQYLCLDYCSVTIYYTNIPLEPEITVNPTTTNFGSVFVGQGSIPQTITVSNNGTADLSIGSITISGHDTNQFSIQNDSCSNKGIVPAASCTLQVVFHPTSNGAKTATLVIPSNDLDEDHVSISLNGTGLSSPPVVTTDSANNLTSTTAKLNGNLSSLGTTTSVIVSFEYGLTDSYGSISTAKQMDTTGIFDISITGLTPNTLFHYRAKAIGVGISHGNDATFSTSSTADGFTNNPDFKIDSKGVVQADVEVITSDGIASLVINKGTIISNAYGDPLTTLTTTKVTAPQQPKENSTFITAYDFGPDGATFDASIILKVTYDPNILPAGIIADKLFIAYWDGSKWVTLASTIDTSSNVVSAQISHFTTFGLFGDPKSAFQWWILMSAIAGAIIGTIIYFAIRVRRNR